MRFTAKTGLERIANCIQESQTITDEREPASLFKKKDDEDDGTKEKFDFNFNYDKKKSDSKISTFSRNQNPRTLHADLHFKTHFKGASELTMKVNSLHNPNEKFEAEELARLRDFQTVNEQIRAGLEDNEKPKTPENFTITFENKKKGNYIDTSNPFVNKKHPIADKETIEKLLRHHVRRVEKKPAQKSLSPKKISTKTLTTKGIMSAFSMGVKKMSERNMEIDKFNN